MTPIWYCGNCIVFIHGHTGSIHDDGSRISSSSVGLWSKCLFIQHGNALNGCSGVFVL